MNNLETPVTQERKRQIFQELKDRICTGRQFGYLSDAKALEVKQMCYCASHLTYLLFGYGMPALVWSKIPMCSKHLVFLTDKIEEPDPQNSGRTDIFYRCDICNEVVDTDLTCNLLAENLLTVLSFEDPFKDEQDYGNMFWNYLSQQFAEFDIMIEKLEANNPKDQLLKLKLGL